MCYLHTKRDKMGQMLEHETCSGRTKAVEG